MRHHVLLIVNSYVTEHDPRRGAKFQVLLERCLDRGWRVGLLSALQRDYGLRECLRRRPFIVEEIHREAGVIRDCTYYGLLSRLPVSVSPLRGSLLAERSFRRYLEWFGRPDLLHAHGTLWAGCLAHRIHLKHEMPYVITEHMSRFLAPDWDHPARATIRDVLARASARLPVSASLGERMERTFAEAFSPWHVIPNMVDDEFFRVTKADYARGANPFRFLSVGRLEPVKGYDILIRAFSRAFAGSDVKLRIGGEGPLREELLRLIEAYDLTAQVTLLGALERSQVVQELNSASACVLSSHEETFGIPLIEALAMGKPVIATRCGGPDSIVTSENGLLVAPGDCDALSRAMQSMHGNYARYDSDRIRETCRRSYGAASVLDRLEAVYERILGGGASNSRTA